MLCKNLHKSDSGVDVTQGLGFVYEKGGEWDWGWKERLLRNVYVTHLVKFTFVSKNKTCI